MARCSWNGAERSVCSKRPTARGASHTRTRRRELFIVGCAQKKKTGKVSLELVTREGRKPLNLELASVGARSRNRAISPRLVALYPGSDSFLFRRDRRELILLQPGDGVLATRQARALIRRGKTLVFYDAEARQGGRRYPPYWINIPRFC